MTKLQAGGSAPLYIQLSDSIKSKIELGEYKVGDKIPSESILSERYNISRITVRKGLQKLVDDKILIKKHGKGTYVSMPIYIEDASTHTGGSFTKSCIKIGKIPNTRVSNITVNKASNDAASHLGVDKEEKVISVTRIRSVDSVPCIIEIDYFRSDFEFILHSDIENNSLLDTLRNNTGIVASNFDDVYDIVRASKIQATLLDTVVGAPLLFVRQVVTDDKEQILYYNEQYIRSEVYKYAVSFTK